MTETGGAGTWDEWSQLNKEIAHILMERATMRRTNTFDPLRDAELHTQQVALVHKLSALYERLYALTRRESPMQKVRRDGPPDAESTRDR